MKPPSTEKWSRHGLSYGKFYRVYIQIKQRCNNPKAGNYHKYGAKGITYNWTTFGTFKEDMYESYLQHVKLYGEKNTTIDRLDNTKGYYKENCRWATYKIQNNNRTKFNKHIEIDGRSKSVAEWAKLFRIKPQTIWSRILTRKWNPILAVTTPINNMHTFWKKRQRVHGRFI